MKYLLWIILTLALGWLWQVLERIYQRKKDSTIFQDREGRDRYK